MVGAVENKAEFALEVVDIRKAFFGNEVLRGISFGIRRGEVLGLLGSNGAGKSTLMKIVNGVYRLDSGSIRVEGKEVQLCSAADAAREGIAMVYQEFSLIPTLTVAENLFLGREKKKRGLIDAAACREAAAQAIEEFGIEIDPASEVEKLSIGNQQLVEIVKALIQRPKVLILDEPTASLTGREILLLFSFIRRLKEQGIAVFLISHHMKEIMEICDRAVVLRNGSVELDRPIAGLKISTMVEAMIGKKLNSGYLAPVNPSGDGHTVLEVENLSFGGKVKDVTFQVHAGEIVGIAGLLGSGRTELMKCIYGLLKPERGSILLEGEPVPVGRPFTSIRRGLAFVPENRRQSGIVGIHSVKYNMLLPIWERMKRGFLIDEKKSARLAEETREKLAIKCTGVEQEVERLSGGNQQKVVFGKSLLIRPKILLLDDPTVGIDVEAKAAAAQLIRETADNGNAVLLVSSEMEELERLCDRVFIMSGGELKKELVRKNGDDLSEAALSETIQQY